MCGIAGMAGPAAERQTVAAMTRRLRHRGPDGDGIFQDGDTILGHSRLSIIDLHTGDQPMVAAGNEACLVHNGEIYNFRQLRRELEDLGHAFHTASDSEVILEGYRAWGTEVLARLDGIFAFALWDRRRRRLLLARDLFGIKPLHYLFDGATLRFASEIKALLQDPGIERDVDFQALHYFLNVRYVPGRRTLFRGIERLPPGHLAIFEGQRLRIARYVAINASQSRARSMDEYAEGVRHHLRAAVRRQLQADVPLGVYLSGGLDSSSIVALMSEVGHGGPVRTFSLGFDQPRDELSDARLVARHFATEHHELTLDLQPLRHYPAVIWATEEPKENILQGYLLAGFARQQVKAVLSGLGGDELFAGYNLHRLLAAVAPLHRWTPGRLQRRLLAPLSRGLFSWQDSAGLRRWDQYRRGLQLLLASGDPCAAYLILRNAWDGDDGAFSRYGPAWPEDGLKRTRQLFEPYFRTDDGVLRQAMDAELETKLIDDLLLNEDRTSMAHGLEVRVPFLDLELVRYVLGIPVGLLAPGRETTRLFRRAMAPLLPRHT
ncbi:MAG: asparagine synthase (glutamine-hydrolyzing), partial [Holophagales bacterium]|nr:asparagine synthase (glutamine-hydrolyzing) [Holophagales bacterium]